MKTCLRRLALAAVMAVAVVGCVPNLTLPARSASSYQEKAATTAAAASSAVATAGLVCEAVADSSATLAYASMAVGDAERDLAGVAVTFSAVLPPDRRSQRLRSQLLSQLHRAAADVADTRIAVRHGWTGKVTGSCAELKRDAGRLARTEARLS